MEPSWKSKDIQATISQPSKWKRSSTQSFEDPQDDTSSLCNSGLDRTQRWFNRGGLDHPRASFDGHVRSVPWANLELTYFVGYAII